MHRNPLPRRVFWVVSVCLVAACGGSNHGSRVPAVATGRSAPDFQANRLDQGTFQFSSLRGHVVVLDLWAAWCEGCADDLPLLDAMASRLGSDVEVVAVSLDADRARLDPIVARRVWRLTMLHEPTGRVGDLYQPSTMPALYLIDGSGIVRQTYLGVRPEQFVAIEAEARRLASASSSQPDPVRRPPRLETRR